MSKRNLNAKGRRIKGGFLMIPHAVLASPAYRGLSWTARSLMVDIGAQFNGKNNGYLSASLALLERSGWRSSSTINSAKQELLDAGLIECTRQGGLHMGPSLYALTWHAIDKQPDGVRWRLDVKPTDRPSRLWRQNRAEVVA